MRSATLILGLLLAAGCSSNGGGGGGNGGGGGPLPPAAVASITVAPPQWTLNRGETVALAAALRDASDNILLGRTVTWTSSDNDKGSVSAAGVVRGLSAGPIVVTATAEGRSGSAQIMIMDPAGPASRVVIEPPSSVIEEGDDVELAATGLDSAGGPVSGRAVRWTSGDTSIAVVSPGGVVTGLRPGTVAITARIDGAEASATVRIYAQYGYDLIFDKADVEVPAELHLLDINDPVGVPLPIFAPGQHSSQAAPSPDGRKIAFVVYGQWDASNWQSMIFVANRDGGGATRLSFLPARNAQPTWSPDGTRIAFRSWPEIGPAHIWVINADGSGLRNLTADRTSASHHSPAWSPPLANGEQRIAYSELGLWTSHLWTMRDDGSDKQPLTNNPAFYDDEPAWSPDGSRLVFTRTGTGIFGDLYIVPSSGGPGAALMPAHPLAFGQFGPRFSPDGRLIAFGSKHGDGERYQIWTVRADGSRLAQRTFELQQHGYPAWIVRLQP